MLGQVPSSVNSPFLETMSMGWSYRKSSNLGPFRINISKSGVGYSIGGRGFRTGISSSGRRYTSYSIPGTGLRYYQSGKRSTSGCLVASCIPILCLVIGLLIAVLRGA
jgi:hypothetical protein